MRKSGSASSRVEGRDGDADADIGDDLVPFDLIRLDDRLADALGKRGRVGRFLHLGHDDGEFVAAQAGNRVGLSGAAAQAVGDQFQQFVADRMPERIVDALELIEIEAQDRQTLTAFDAFELMFQPFAQQDAVGQIGQRVVARHMRDAPIGAQPLGDVLVGRQPSAARDRLARRPKCPAIGQMHRVIERRLGRDALFKSDDVFVGVVGKSSGLNALDEEVAQVAPGPRDFRQQSVHFDVACIAKN